MKDYQPQKYRLNSDRLEIIEKIHSMALESGLKISKEEVEDIIEGFEVLMRTKLSLNREQKYIWRIPGIIDIGVEQKFKPKPRKEFLSKTFNEVVVHLFKKT